MTFFKKSFFLIKILCKLTIGGRHYSSLGIKDKGIDYNGEIKQYSHQILHILQSFIDPHFNAYSLEFSSSIHIIGRGFVICSKSLVKERQFSYRVINKQLFLKDDIHQLTGHLTSKAKEKKIAVQLGKWRRNRFFTMLNVNLGAHLGNMSMLFSHPCIACGVRDTWIEKL